MAEISGGVYFFPCISTRASPFSPRTTLYGTIFCSSVTSSRRRPMNRLIEKTVFSGLVMDCRLANQPLARFGEGDDRRRGSAALLICDHCGLPALHDRDHRIGGAEIDAD